MLFINVSTKSSTFSFIELLVSIACLSLLITLLSPSLKKMLVQGQRSEAGNNLRNIYQAQIMYAEDFKDRIVPLSSQNPYYTPRPPDWRQNLHTLYLNNDSSSFHNNEIFGNKTHLEQYPDRISKASFTMNVRLGYRPNPYGFQGPTTLNEVLHPNLTFFFGDGKYNENRRSFTPHIWPLQGFDDYYRQQLLLTFLDGHITLHDHFDIPQDPNRSSQAHLLFWRGRKTPLP